MCGVLQQIKIGLPTLVTFQYRCILYIFPRSGHLGAKVACPCTDPPARFLAQPDGSPRQIIPERWLPAVVECAWVSGDGACAIYSGSVGVNVR